MVLSSFVTYKIINREKTEENISTGYSECDASEDELRYLISRQADVIQNNYINTMKSSQATTSYIAKKCTDEIMQISEYLLADKYAWELVEKEYPDVVFIMEHDKLGVNFESGKVIYTWDIWDDLSNETRYEIRYSANPVDEWNLVEELISYYEEINPQLVYVVYNAPYDAKKYENGTQFWWE